MNPPIESVPPEETADNTSPAPKRNAQLPTNIEPSPRNHGESYYTKPDPTPLWKTLLEVVVGAAVISYTIVASLQLSTMNKTYRSTVESFRVDERAWVEIEPIKPILLTPADQQFSATYTCDIFLKNVGKTSAFNIEARASDVMSIDGWDDKADDVERTHNMLYSPEALADISLAHVPRVLAPNSTSPVPFRLTYQATKPFPSWHNEVHYLIGKVNYCDQFNVAHSLRFCFFVSNNRGEIWACKNGNDEDRNDESSTPSASCRK